jgi:hypothetical protein
MLNQSIAHLPIPERMQNLPISDKGFPIPWFVYIDPVTNESDFRVIGSGKLVMAHQKHLCWLCGQKMGTYNCFVVGPMCTINRVSAEPPSHIGCATYAVRACPFLTQPRMRRNKKDQILKAREVGGVMLKRNPGVTALWCTKTYEPFRVHNGVLFYLGPPTEVQWWSEGRTAKLAEVQASIDSGLPALIEMAKLEGRRAEMALAGKIEVSKQWLPSEQHAT